MQTVSGWFTKKNTQQEVGTKAEQQPLMTQNDTAHNPAFKTTATRGGATGNAMATGWGYTHERGPDAKPKDTRPITQSGNQGLKTFILRCFLPLIFYPFCVFFGIQLLVILLYSVEPAIVMFIVFFLFVANLAFIFMTIQDMREKIASGVGGQKRLGGKKILTLVSLLSALICVMCGSLSGASAYDAYFFPYYAFWQRAEYTNVMPSGLAKARGDAGSIVFSEDARVETTTTVGFKVGTTYCVAPVLDDRTTAVQYWAVGKDCCKARSDFTCSDALSAKAKSGLVVRQSGMTLFGNDIEIYMDAVKQSGEVYGYVSAENPLLVRWVEDIETTNTIDFTNGWKQIAWTASVALISLSIVNTIIFYFGKAGAERRKAGDTASHTLDHGLPA